jgi:hypothetical protein
MSELLKVLLPLILSLLDKSKSEQAEILTLYKAVVLCNETPEDRLAMKLAECFVKSSPERQAELCNAVQGGSEALAALAASRAK